MDRAERLIVLLAENQIAIQKQHDDDFKKIMTWQVLMQDHEEKMDRTMQQLGGRMDRLVLKGTAQSGRSRESSRAAVRCPMPFKYPW